MPNSMIELKFDLLDLKKQLDKGTPLSIKRRRRASTAPPAPRGSKHPIILANLPCSAKLSTCTPFYTQKSGECRVWGDAL
ncbi:unnamed protein product [Strongylus vulgaris]|uniref:Uncharacterized protein n=1 Tax=Strongylus vulgaris TaxID=40348 RepID=A0A3P7K7H6_STRVU|nr:unnamed protein product [Strongylus vulgaris]